jgi:hypothetical protein
VTGWFRWIVLISGALTLLGVPACGEPAAERDKPKPVPADQQILAQYRKLWTETIPAATAATASARKPILAATMTDPALSDVVTRYQNLEKAGRRSYGRIIPLRQAVTVSGKTAVVDGCLDESNSGVANRKTGQKLTKGVATSPVRLTFVEGPDGLWRVSKTAFPVSKSC